MSKCLDSECENLICDECVKPIREGLGIFFLEIEVNHQISRKTKRRINERWAGTSQIEFLKEASTASYWCWAHEPALEDIVGTDKANLPPMREMWLDAKGLYGLTRCDRCGDIMDDYEVYPCDYGDCGRATCAAWCGEPDVSVAGYLNAPTRRLVHLICERLPENILVQVARKWRSRNTTLVQMMEAASMLEVFEIKPCDKHTPRVKELFGRRLAQVQQIRLLYGEALR